MTANVNPIFSRVGDIQWTTVPIAAAHNAADLTSGTSYLVFTADAAEGGYVQEVRLKPNPGTNTAQCVLRVWINNGSTIATAANSALFAELGIPATTTSTTIAQPEWIVPLGFALPLGFKIYVTVSAYTAGGFTAGVVGGKY